MNENCVRRAMQQLELMILWHSGWKNSTKLIGSAINIKIGKLLKHVNL